MGTDIEGLCSHDVNMAEDAPHVWYLHEWFAASQKKQRALISELGWPPQKANRIWHGVQPFRATDLKEVADLLQIRVHELLMHPDDAMRARQIEAALSAVSRSPEPPAPAAPAAPAAKRRTGTHG